MITLSAINVGNEINLSRGFYLVAIAFLVTLSFSKG